VPKWHESSLLPYSTSFISVTCWTQLQASLTSWAPPDAKPWYLCVWKDVRLNIIEFSYTLNSSVFSPPGLSQGIRGRASLIMRTIFSLPGVDARVPPPLVLRPDLIDPYYSLFSSVSGRNINSLLKEAMSLLLRSNLTLRGSIWFC
jgi:hypothetical protein